MKKVFIYPIIPKKEVEDRDIHVNHLRYIKWMQEAAEAHSAYLGWDNERYLSHQVTWFVRKHEIEYLKPLFPGDKVMLQTWVQDMGKASSTRRFRFYRLGSSAELAAVAKTLWVFVNLKSEKATPILPEVSASFYPLGESVVKEPHYDTWDKVRGS